MESNNKKVIRLSFLSFAISSMLALSGCTLFQSQSSSHSSIANSSSSENQHSESSSEKKTSSSSERVSESSSSEKTSESSSVHSISETSSSEASSSVKDDSQELLNFASQIEQYYKDEINKCLDDTVISSVTLNYFVVKDSLTYGKTLEANGSVKMAEDQAKHSVTLGLPLEENDFDNLHYLNFAEYDSAKTIVVNYTIDDLQSINNLLSSKKPTFTYARKDDIDWNLDELSPAQVEEYLEAKYLQSTQDFFIARSNVRYIDELDFRYVQIEKHNVFGKNIQFHGFARTMIDTILEYYIRIEVSDDSYTALEEILKDKQYNDALSLRTNYTKEQLNVVYTIIDETETIVREYVVNRVGYMVKYT